MLNKKSYIEIIKFIIVGIINTLNYYIIYFFIKHFNRSLFIESYKCFYYQLYNFILLELSFCL